MRHRFPGRADIDCKPSRSLAALRVAEDSEREQLKIWADQVEADDAYGG